MLSGLAASAAVTAVVAGMTGAWSPCGLSMVETIGGALGDARRSATLLACATFAMGAVIGGALTFGGLAFGGRLIGLHAGPLRDGLGAGIALAAAVADWRGVRIAPQIRRQVPERWRWTLPLPLACCLYGILLGLGFTTFVLAFAVWALAGISFAAGSLTLGLLVGVAFGAGRALPVLWMAPGFHGGDGARRLDGIAADPRMWLGLRRLDALGLGVCALFLSGASAAAATLPRATDPSAAGAELAWQQVDGTGMLLRAGTVSALPGRDPALGQSSIGWWSNGRIVIADRTSSATKVTFAVAQVSALAVSDSWVVYRDQGSDRAENLIALSLLTPGVQRDVATAPLAGELGRPALDGSTVVFTIDTPRHNAIEAVNLLTGAPRVLRYTAAGSALLNPALLDGRLLYERVGRCAQQLRIGSPNSSAGDRVLLSLRSTVWRDPGYEQSYEHAYNGASVCRNRRAGRGGATLLGPTALAGSTAYVTELSPDLNRARIVTVAR